MHARCKQKAWAQVYIVAQLFGVTSARWPCKNNLDCISRCVQNLKCDHQRCSTLRDACRLVACASPFGSCFCGGASLLRHDGTCASALKASRPSCNFSHSAIFSVAVWNSPELGPGDVRAGRLSPPMRNLLDRSLAAGLWMPLEDFHADVRFSTKQVSGDIQSVQNVPGSLLHFDIVLDFCISGQNTNVFHSSAASHQFERLFVRESMKYAIFELGTIRALTLDYLISSNHLALSTTKFPERIAHLRFGAGTRHSSRDDRDDHTFPWIPMLVIFAWLLFALLGVLCMTSRTWWRKGKHTNIIQFPTECATAFSPWPSPPYTPRSEDEEPEVRHEDTRHICVTKAFDVSEFELDEHILSSILKVEDGDAVEVLSGDSGWYYGHIFGNSDHAGYFPQSLVSGWVTGSPTHELPHCPALGNEDANRAFQGSGSRSWQHSTNSAQRSDDDRTSQYLCETYAFTPELYAELDVGSSAYKFLSLDDGDVVEVLDGCENGDWLFGRIFGTPDRVGIFPRGHVVSWVHTPGMDTGSTPAPSDPAEGRVNESQSARADHVQHCGQPPPDEAAKGFQCPNSKQGTHEPRENVEITHHDVAERNHDDDSPTPRRERRENRRNRRASKRSRRKFSESPMSVEQSQLMLKKDATESGSSILDDSSTLRASASVCSDSRDCGGNDIREERDRLEDGRNFIGELQKALPERRERRGRKGELKQQRKKSSMTSTLAGDTQMMQNLNNDEIEVPSSSKGNVKNLCASTSVHVDVRGKGATQDDYETKTNSDLNDDGNGRGMSLGGGHPRQERGKRNESSEHPTESPRRNV